MSYRQSTRWFRSFGPRVSVLIAVAMALAACATPDSHPRLDEANNAFQQAKSAGAAEHAPVAFHEAGQALDRARDSLNDGDDEAEIEHYAFIAKTRADIARIRAEEALNTGEIDKLAGERQRLLLEAREQRALEAERRAEMAREQAQLAEQSVEQARRETEEMKSRAAQLESQLASLQVTAQQRGDELVLTLGNLVFDFDRTELKPGVQRNLQPLVDLLQDFPERGIRIEGYTDSVGSEQYNEQLSNQRADTVKDFLVNQGVDPARITASGLGERFPIASNETREGRQMNRRVEIVVAEPAATGAPGGSPSGMPGDAAGRSQPGTGGDDISAAPATGDDALSAFP